MFPHIKKPDPIFIAALMLGGVGAFGQAFLLFHELEHTYPYKVMDYEFYSKIAHTGLVIAPLFAVICGFSSGLKRFWFALIVPVVSCPLAFAFVFRAFSLITVGSDWNFDNSTPVMAARDFYLYTVYLAIAGFLIGSACSLLLSYLIGLTRSRRLA